MIRGVSLNISKYKTERLLYDILNCIKVRDYIWYNIKSQSETWANSYGDDFLSETKYDGITFSDLICQPHYIVFLKLQAYVQEGAFTDIHSYYEFEQSKCQIVVLINDCSFVEIYTKDVNLAMSFFETFNLLNLGNVNYITENNDFRRKMDVL